MSQIYVDPATKERHEFPDDATAQEIDAATRQDPSKVGAHAGKVPGFGADVTIAPNAQPGNWRMKGLGGGEPSRPEEFTRAGLTLVGNVLAGAKAGGAGFKQASANEAATQMLNRTGRYPSPPSAQPTPPGGLANAAAHISDMVLPKYVGAIIRKLSPGATPVDMNAPATGGGPVPPGLTRTPIVPTRSAGPEFQPAQVGTAHTGNPQLASPLDQIISRVHGPESGPTPSGIAKPSPAAPAPSGLPYEAEQAIRQALGLKASEPLPSSWLKGAQIDTKRAGAPAPEPLPQNREHKPGGFPGTPHEPVRGEATGVNPSGTASTIANDPILKSALEAAAHWKHMHNKGFRFGGQVR
jgi:hypothetical protein